MPALASGPGFLHPVGFYLDLAHLRYPQTFLSSLSMVVGPMEEVLNQPKCKMTIFFAVLQLHILSEVLTAKN